MRQFFTAYPMRNVNIRELGRSRFVQNKGVVKRIRMFMLESHSRYLNHLANVESPTWDGKHNDNDPNVLKSLPVHSDPTTCFVSSKTGYRLC